VDVPALDASREWISTATLFSESASRVVVSVAQQNLAALLEHAKTLGVPAREIGTTGSARISVSINGRLAIDLALSEAETIWESALEKYFKQRAA
jgi:phosphoribosylformylglycinamidine synthase